MADLGSWRTLRGAEASDGKETILAVNYFVTGRPEAGFDDLVRELKTEHPVWETLPPAVGSEIGMSGADYVARWAEDVRRSGRTVRGILGNCAGSAYVPALADQIATWQHERPIMVLFDPETPTALMLYWQFHGVIGASAALLSPDELSDAQHAGQRAMAKVQDLGSLATELVALFRKVGGLTFDRLGLDADRQAEMVALFSSYMSYLVAASQVTTPKAWSMATAVSSSTPGNGLNRLPDEERSQWVGQELRFDVEHTELLRSAEVARAVSELLG